MFGVYGSSFKAIGTTCSVLTNEEGVHEQALEVVRREVATIDRACSRFRDDSELSILNRNAGKAMRISQVLVDALDAALRAAEITDGILDPTVGQSMRVIGYDRTFEEINDRKSYVTRYRVAKAQGWRAVQLDRAARTVRIPSGCSLDLGATAKALLADRAAQAAFRATGAGVLVNLGGDIAASGFAPTGGWIVGIADNHRSHSAQQEVVMISGGLATSSTAVRRWARNGAEMHHIVDPATGEPAEVVWRTVSVFAANCLDANIASTASIIKGDSAPAWLTEHELDARLVRANGDVVFAGDWPVEVPCW